MKKLFENEYFKNGLTVFISLSLVIIFYLSLSKFYLFIDLFKFILKVLSPFITGFILAYLLNPLVKKISSKLNTKNEKLDKILSIILVYFIIFLIILLTIFLVIPELLKSVEVFLVNIPTYLSIIKDYFNNMESKIHLEQLFLENYEFINNTITSNINSKFIPALDSLISKFTLSIFSFLSVLFNFIVGLIVSIYYLVDKEYFKNGLLMFNELIFGKNSEKIKSFFQKLDLIIGQFFIGRVLDGLTIGTIAFLFFIIFNYPFALLFAVILGLTNIIPYFGPLLGGAPVALMILLQDPSKIWLFLIFIFILQQLDGYVIGPALSGKKVGLKSFWVLFSILVFGSIFGIPGMILGVPIFAIIQLYLLEYINKYKKTKIEN